MALYGVQVVEFAGLAPGPFAGLILADNGASVTRIDKPDSASIDTLSRGKKSLAINPKTPSGLEVLKKLIGQADVLIDPFRPGVLERLGLGPNVFLDKASGLNPKLIYARLSGFPPKGGYTQMAGHDINYVALSGVLSTLPRPNGIPIFPINLLADFAGGGLTCAMGILLALAQRGRTGRGQVVNVDMVSGTRYLSSFILSRKMLNIPGFASSPGENLLDGGAPFYNTYTCADTDSGPAWVAVGCLEPQFFADFISRFTSIVGPDGDDWKPTPETQARREDWPKLKVYLTNGFASRTREFWTGVFKGTESCVTPVLTVDEAASLAESHAPLPDVHPRLSTTPPNAHTTDPINLVPGTHNQEVLTQLGLSEDDIKHLQAEGALGAKFRNKL